MKNDEIIFGFKTGDERVLKYYFEKKIWLFQSIVNSAINDWDEAKDIVAGCFVKLWENREKFDHIKGIDNYMNVSCMNSVRNVIRRRKMIERVHSDILENEDHEKDEFFDCLYIRSKLMQELIKEIGSHLSPSEKNVFELEYVYGLKTSEISKVLNASMSTIGVLKFRINKKIQAMRPLLQKL